MSAELSEIRERLARIETTQHHQNVVLDKLDGKLGSIDEKLDTVDGRLNAVEARSAGLGTLAGGVMAVAVSLVSAKLTGRA